MSFGLLTDGKRNAGRFSTGKRVGLFVFETGVPTFRDFMRRERHQQKQKTSIPSWLERGYYEGV